MVAPDSASPASTYSNYQRLPSLVLGFHGCDRKVGEAVLSGAEPHLLDSNRETDWLGTGIYFWENDPVRALEWAVECQKNPKQTSGDIQDPFVIGAVIEFGFCLNLQARECLDEISVAYNLLRDAHALSGDPMPENKGPKGVQRYLDRAVVEALHRSREKSGYQEYETVRSAFMEGKELYPGAGFEHKNHVQIAVRKRARIRGYFRPLPDEAPKGRIP
jgi:hypothetical protein